MLYLVRWTDDEKDILSTVRVPEGRWHLVWVILGGITAVRPLSMAQSLQGHEICTRSVTYNSHDLKVELVELTHGIIEACQEELALQASLARIYSTA